MKRICLYILAGLLIASAFGALIYSIIPTQEQQVAAIRDKSKIFLVVTRDLFVDGLRPWKARRESQGFEVIIKSFSKSPGVQEIRQWISQSNEQSNNPCRYIMLVGDNGGPDEIDAPWHIPAIFGEMGYKYEEDEAARPIVSDAPYGDIDDDGQMEVAVGRLPVHSLSELELQIAKIAQHEGRVPEPDFYRAVLWTGGKHFHNAMYTITLQFMEHMLPDWLYPYFISSQQASVCSGPVAEQPKRFLEAISQPAYISMVVGHGDYNNLRCVEKDGEELPLLVEQVQGLTSETAVGPLILIACDAGSYYLPTEKGPCMAEAFLHHPGGPVAVIAAAGYINVVANFYLTGSIANFIKEDNKSIGDLLVDSRQILYKVGKYTLRQIREHDTRTHRLIAPPSEKDMDLYSRKNLIRNEGLLYNLLGDPSLVFKKPASLQVDVRQTGERQFQLSGVLPRDARQIWVQHYDLNRFRGYVSMDTQDEDLLRRQFYQANQPPEVLIKRPFSGDTWQLKMDLNSMQMPYGSRIRVMAIGEHNAYYKTLATPLHNTETADARGQ